MKVTVCQLDNREQERAAMLDKLAAHIVAEQAQLLLLPEMCFADCLAADPEADHQRWLRARQQ
jgi:predicted amidohydrolase